MHSEKKPDYKKLYEESKENVKRFIEMVELEMSVAIEKHNEEVTLLKREITRLRTQNGEKLTRRPSSVDVSNFTARSKRSSQHFYEAEQLANQNSMANEFQKASLSMVSESLIQPEINTFKGTRKRKLFSGNLSNLSSQNTLFEFDNMLLGLNTKEKINSNSFTTNSTVSNANNRTTKNRFTRPSQVHFEATEVTDGTKQRSKMQNLTSQSFGRVLTEKIQNTISGDLKRKGNNDNGVKKEHKFQESSEKKDEVHSLLKNMRKSMKKNIEKESSLEAPILPKRG